MQSVLVKPKAVVFDAVILCAPKDLAACSGRHEIDEYQTEKRSTTESGLDRRPQDQYERRGGAKSLKMGNSRRGDVSKSGAWAWRGVNRTSCSRHKKVETKCTRGSARVQCCCRRIAR